MGGLNKSVLLKKNQVRQLFLLYALMGSCVMDAIEGRKVITVNIPGVFLQGD